MALITLVIILGLTSVGLASGDAECSSSVGQQCETGDNIGLLQSKVTTELSKALPNFETEEETLLDDNDVQEVENSLQHEADATNGAEFKDALQDLKEAEGSGRDVSNKITGKDKKAVEDAIENESIDTSPGRKLCQDLPGAKSGLAWSDGSDNCASYGANKYCPKYGGTDFGEGTANDKCCVCGGGATPVPATTTCQDLPGSKSGLAWSDGSDNCASYGANKYCPKYGGTDFGEGTANVKCCVCGGGATATTSECFTLALRSKDRHWSQYCRQPRGLSWVIAQDCKQDGAGWYGNEQYALSQCKRRMWWTKCLVFDKDGAKCGGGATPVTPVPAPTPPPPTPKPVPAPSPTPSTFSGLYGPPFEGAFTVSQGPLDCSPSHCDASKRPNSPDNAYAIDWPMPRGTRIIASRKGKVTYIRDYQGEGGSCYSNGVAIRNFHPNLVAVSHDDGTVAEYLHLRDGLKVKVGDEVQQGSLLGIAGNSGCSTEPHLHFHVLKDAQSRATIPIRFTFPCLGKSNVDASRDSFLCNDPDCKCVSTRCSSTEISQKTQWKKYCRQPWGLSFVMPQGCNGFWYGSEKHALSACQQGTRSSAQCFVYDKDGAKCQ